MHAVVQPRNLSLTFRLLACVTRQSTACEYQMHRVTGVVVELQKWSHGRCGGVLPVYMCSHQTAGHQTAGPASAKSSLLFSQRLPAEAMTLADPGHQKHTLTLIDGLCEVSGRADLGERNIYIYMYGAYTSKCIRDHHVWGGAADSVVARAWLSLHRRPFP